MKKEKKEKTKIKWIICLLEVFSIFIIFKRFYNLNEWFVY
jgi:hypothetical protein